MSLLERINGISSAGQCDVRGSPEKPRVDPDSSLHLSWLLTHRLEARGTGGQTEDAGGVREDHGSHERSESRPRGENRQRMKWYRYVMRFLARRCEEQRMEFRHELARVNAHADDLIRTIRR